MAASVSASNAVAAQKAVGRVFGKGGYLEQARKAQASGVLADFFKLILSQLGPMVGPMIVQLLMSLLHI